jgi:hypothetical protein
MKMTGGILLLRIHFEREKGLTDAEWRLWLIYWALTVWDEKKYDFGTSTITIAELKKYLDWSSGSICTTQKALIAKGKIKKVSRSKYTLVDANKLLRKRFRDSEIAIQGIESAVHWAEKKQTRAKFSQRQENAEKPRFSAHDFQSAEFGNTPKETIKKNKEIREERISLREKGSGEPPPWRDPEHICQFQESLKKQKR